MKLEWKRVMVFTGGMALIFCLVSAAALWMIPRPHGALHFMVAGALATAVSLGAGFVAIEWLTDGRRPFVPVVRIRIARRSSTPRVTVK